MNNIKWWPRCSRSDPKIGHERVEPIASVSWRIRWSDISCVPSRHQHDKERRNDVQVQDEPSRRDHMLEACHPYGVHGYVKICLKRVSPIGLWGSIWQNFTEQGLACSIKKGVPTWGGQDRHHLAQVECTRQRYDFDRFSLLPVSWCLLGDQVIG